MAYNFGSRFYTHLRTKLIYISKLVSVFMNRCVMMKNKTTIITLASLVLSASCFSVLAATRAVPVVAEQVEMQEVSQSLTLVGKLEAEQSVIISPEVTGKVDRIAVKENQQVKKGQLLVQLDADKIQASQIEANAYLRDEQRKLREFERLVKRNAITQTEIDAQKASVEIAQARLAAADANLADLNITAPFAGTVGFIDFSRGKMVSAGSELLTLDDLSVMQLDLRVPERYLSLIETEMAVTASTSAWGERSFYGSVVGVDTRINSETLNLRVRIHFDNQDLALKPGMLMSATLAFPPLEAPIIPVQAIEYSGTKRYVYVIDQNNVAHRREVVLGARVENRVVIDKGLTIGEKIVVQGIVNMRDGSPVSEVGADGRPVNQEDAL